MERVSLLQCSANNYFFKIAIPRKMNRRSRKKQIFEMSLFKDVSTCNLIYCRISIFNSILNRATRNQFLICVYDLFFSRRWNM